MGAVVTASGSIGGPRQGPSGVSAIAGRRAEGEDFLASFLELQEAVRASCRRQGKWEAKATAGIQAILDFAAAHPGKARALTLEARRPAFGDRNPEQVVIAYFSGRLAEITPAAKLVGVSNDQSVIEVIAAFVRGHLLGGTEDQLPDSAPDLVSLILMPYLGLAETSRWIESIPAAPR